jgi:hypothetical protein
MEGTAFLDDDVFSGKEQIFDTTMQHHEIHKCLDKIQTKIWSKSFILAYDHLSERHSSNVQLGEEECIGLIDHLLLVLQLLSLFLILTVNVLDFVRVVSLLVVTEIIEDSLSVLEDAQTGLQL